METVTARTVTYPLTLYVEMRGVVDTVVLREWGTDGAAAIKEADGHDRTIGAGLTRSGLKRADGTTFALGFLLSAEGTLVARLTLGCLSRPPGWRPVGMRSGATVPAGQLIVFTQEGGRRGIRSVSTTGRFGPPVVVPHGWESTRPQLSRDRKSCLYQPFPVRIASYSSAPPTDLGSPAPVRRRRIGRARRRRPTVARCWSQSSAVMMDRVTLVSWLPPGSRR